MDFVSGKCYERKICRVRRKQKDIEIPEFEG